MDKKLQIMPEDYEKHDFGWLVVLGLTALWDSISVYIGPSPRERAETWNRIVKYQIFRYFFFKTDFKYLVISV